MTNIEKLMDEIKARIKAIPGKLFVSVENYGGEFSSDEVDFKSFSAPAAFVSCLGWRKVDRPLLLSGKYIWRARIAIFIATKETKRDSRMVSAMSRAAVLSAHFQGWRPEACSGRAEDIDSENLYNRAIDKKGLALWMVSWWHEIELEDGQTPGHDDLSDLKRVEIESGAKKIVDADPAPSSNTNLTHKLEMNDG